MVLHTEYLIHLHSLSHERYPNPELLDVYKRQTFGNGYVNNKVMEFVGPGVGKLSADFRIGIDVMTTETTCLSSIWRTDDKIKEFYDIHGRSDDFRELEPGAVAYYDGLVYVNLSEIKPMIAMPFHPSNVYTIEDVNACLLYTSSRRRSEAD